MVRHKKIAVRDKFYTLAKEQGWRARSSFKLIQMNRKYHVLDNAKRVIDLCAAPGGWCQVCAKFMPMTPERKIIGVDLLPIRPMKGVVTFQADITSQYCRQIIQKEMVGEKADVVLCDGAPNVGSEYSHDAFIQAELVLHALRFATEHLAKNGTFISKVFRSADYNSLMWVMQQFFRKVEATKPESSRNVSAEIFVVCQGYLAPDKIDPRLLDSKYVFQQVDANEDPDKRPLALSTLFHKKDNQTRQREGYDDKFGITQRSAVSAYKFILSNDPVRILSECSEIIFDGNIVNATEEEIEKSKEIAQHPATTPVIRELCADLKLLSKGDFKTIMKWRVLVEGGSKKKDHLKGSAKNGDDIADALADKDDEEELDPEEKLEREMDELEEKLTREELKEKRKKLKAKSKQERKRELNALNQQALDSIEAGAVIFDSAELTSGKSKEALEAFIQGKELPTIEVVEKEEVPKYKYISTTKTSKLDFDDDDDYLAELEEQMDAGYEEYRKKRQEKEPMSVQQRRQERDAAKMSKMKKKALEALSERDFHIALEEAEREAYEKGVKDKKLRKKLEGKLGDSDDDDDSDIDIPAPKVRVPLDAETRAARWFSQPAFDGMDVEGDDDVEEDEADGENDDEYNEDEDEDDEEKEEKVPYMPLPSSLTDKAIRHEKRLKLLERKAKKEDKKRMEQEKFASMFEPGALNASRNAFEVVSRANEKSMGEDGDNDDDDLVSNSSDEAGRKTETTYEAKKRMREEKRAIAAEKARELISKTAIKKRKTKNGAIDIKEDTNDEDGFKVVPKVHSERGRDSDEDSDMEIYNSDEYDSDERAEHLALGSLVVKKSTRDALLESAYNRYTFNDPDELPAWFVEDEGRHNRPQLPITKEMVEAVKERFRDLASKPIKKVAEARARKKQQSVKRLAKAKAKAAEVLDAPDLTAKSKMKAIAKIYKGAQPKNPGKIYAIATQTGKNKFAGAKKGGNIKLVDKRMKKDKRAQKANDKRKKGKR